MSSGIAMRCPTCRAEQDWSDACRRCRSDLRLLREFHDAELRLRAQCLIDLDAGRFGHALDHAHAAVALRSDPANLKLLAVCFAAVGEFRLALSMASRLPDFDLETPPGDSSGVILAEPLPGAVE